MARVKLKYAVVIEKAEGNYSSYVPDLPGCIATGSTVQEVEAELREGIAFHIQGMREDGTPIPAPTSRVEYIEPAEEQGGVRAGRLHHSLCHRFLWVANLYVVALGRVVAPVVACGVSVGSSVSGVAVFLAEPKAGAAAC